MHDIIETVRKELKQNVDKKTQSNSQIFFKEKIQFYGVKVPVVHKISKELFKSVEDKTKSEIFELCEILWQSGILEESFVACNWSYYMRKQYEPADIKLFEKWIDKYVNNWASCDTFCNHSVGELLEHYPDQIHYLKIWATSNNRWMRRASAVSLIIPARKGKFINDIFKIADILLQDKDDLVQKGYGWMLKATSQYYQKEVFYYVINNKTNMPRTALRYAIEKMPKELRTEAMKK
ncbi:MAG: DNA alkylation repair protein [Thiohalospira sp.]